MKKLIFLISLCLLSQNCTIANENGESHYGVPVPSNVNDGNNVLRSQNFYSSSFFKPNGTSTVQTDAIDKSNLKFPGLSLPQLDTEDIQVPVNPLPEATVTDFEEEQPSQPLTRPAVLKTLPQPQEDAIEAEAPIEQDQVIEKPQAVEKPQPVETPTETEQVQPNDPMSILRSQTQMQRQERLLINPTQKIKTIPQYADTQNSTVAEQKPKDSSENTNSNQPLTITIKKVEFSNSKVFSAQELQELAAPLLSGPVTIADIQKVVSDITRCYTLGNYPTAKAYLPPQKISDGVLRIELFEGTIGKIKVEDNRWVKTNYFKKRIVKDKEGELLNIRELEKDVTKFNNTNSTKVRVSLEAGENRGETDITLKAIEPFPVRIAVMTDNMGRKAIGTGRFGSMLTTDSLLGVGDKMSLGGYLGRGNRVGFADYNMPINRFGTKLGVSASAGNISVVNGPLRQFDVGGTSQVYSVYLSHPLYEAEGASISSYTAANFKKSTSDITDIKFYDKSTFSLTQGFNLRKDTDKGIWFTGHSASVGFKALSGDEDFFKYEGNITRLHDFGKGIIGQFRVSGQYSPDKNLPWMEQFQIGGMSTVRGYSEALLLGKSGYFASAEILTPLPILPKRIGSDKLGYIYPREMIKGAVFMDNGMIFPYKDGASIDSGELLMSWGMGLRVNLKEDLAARFYWGYGLHNKYEADHKLGRFHFDLTCSPDIGKLVSGRKPSSQNKKNNGEDL